jgi:hypothetical protein
VAENEVILGVALDTKKAVESLNSFQDTATKVFAAVAAAATAVFASRALFNGISSVVDAANEQVDAVNRMNQSLVAAGDYSKAASDSMVEFAKSLSDLVAIDDDNILQSLALAKSFGATNEQAKALVTTAADLAAAMGTDLDTAVTQLGGTLSGTAGKLTKIAPELKNVSEEALKSGEAIRILGQRFAGSASAATETFTGAIKKAALSFDDFETALGLIITQNPALRKVISAFSDLFGDLAKEIDKNKDALTSFITNGILKTVSGISLLIQAFGAFSGVLDPIKDGLIAIAKGFETILFAAKSAGRILGFFNDVSDQEALAEKNLQELIDSFSELDKIGNVDLGKISDSLTLQAVDFAEELKRNVEQVVIDKEIPVNIAPVIKPGFVLEIKSENLKFPDLGSFQLPEQTLPVAGAVTPTDAQSKAAASFEADQQKAVENRAAQASALIGAFQKGGKEGAQQLVSAAATAIAAAFGAGPFAQVIGELVTLLTTDGVVQLIKSVLDNIDVIVESLAENMPQVALALIEVLGNPLFYIRVVNALVDGVTTGIDKAFKDAGPKITAIITDAVNVFGSLFNDATGGFGTTISNAATDFYDQISFAFTTAASTITSIFTDIGKAFNDFVDRITGGGAKSEGAKASGKIKATGQNVGEALGFGLTGDAGTIQTTITPNDRSTRQQSSVTDTLLLQILNALTSPTTVKSSVQVDGKAFADIMLELSRRNARTA